MKIFILEDDPPYFQRYEGFSKAFNEYKGHEVTIAKTFKEGMDKFQPPYDLVLLDFDITGKDQHSYIGDPDTGYTFVQQKGNLMSAYPNMRVIVHSWNNEGAAGMTALLKEHGASVSWEPYGPRLLSMLSGLAGKRDESGFNS